MPRVLVVDDEEVLARAICNYLRKRDVEAEYATNARDALVKFVSLRPDMTFLDFRIGKDDGLEVLGRLRARDRNARVIMMTGHGDIALAVNAMKAGANDFMTKPVPLATIAGIVLQNEIAIRDKPPSRTNAAPAEASLATQIVGRSTAAEGIRKSIQRILSAVKTVSIDLPPVLITGESGTGKELVANAIHVLGPRAKGPFVPINCAALPAELVESELFGHERGAFTDARAQKPGLFEAAGGGILFLDEVGDMPADAQAKLLRVLENRSMRRVGGIDEKQVDVWVMAATNHNLLEKVANGTFRSDLFYRLQVLWVDVPPLRERDSDVLMLADHFLARASQRYGLETPVLSAEARSKILAHTWPGNIRELRNAMERTALIAGSHEIRAIDIDLPEHLLTAANGDQKPARLRDMEIATLKNALLKSGGNVSQAATNLGVSRDTLRYRMQKFGLGRGPEHNG